VPAARYLSRYDTGGLAVDGRTYTIDANDTPGGVAEKVTGSAGRYTELFAANPTKSTVQTSYGRNFKYFPVGEVLKLPESWWPTGGTPTTPSTPTSTSPIPIPGAGSDDDVTAAEILKSKAILVAWSKSDGAAAGALPDYGSQPTDLLPSWVNRDRQALIAWANWRTSYDGSVDGELRQKDVDELAAWAEEKAQAEPTPPPTTTPTSPTPPTTPTTPPSTPTPGTVSTPPVTLPGGFEIPPITLPTTPTAPTTPTPPSTPTTPSTPTPPVSAPTTPAASGDGASPAASGGVGDVAPALAVLAGLALLL
jgi:hypothetical protein